MAKVFFSTGSNQGNRLSWLVKAYQLMENKIGRVVAFSPVLESEPWGFVSATTFYNQVLLIETHLTPEYILKKIKSIEHELGRARLKEGYSDRTIDIDLLFYDQLQLKKKDLIIPHPHMHFRRFVLEPLVAIDPEMRHPALNVSVSELLAHLNDNSRVSMVLSRIEFENLLHTFSLVQD